MKFSGSPNRAGKSRAKMAKPRRRNRKPTVSLAEKYQWKGTLLELELTPRGLLDPVWWRKRRCRMERAASTKGRRKCRAKNRVRVAESTAKPPHNHSTKVFPIYGNAEKRFVITVAAQNLIWPQTSTYPMNAVAITRTTRITPIFHVSWKR